MEAKYIKIPAQTHRQENKLTLLWSHHKTPVGSCAVESWDRSQNAQGPTCEAKSALYRNLRS